MIKLKSGANTLYVDRYESILELVENASLPMTKNMRGLGRPSRSKKERSFGAKDFQDAVNLIHNGWAEGIKKVDSEIEAQVLGGTGPGSHEVSYEFHGDMIDMGRHMTGQPDCFMEQQVQDHGMGGPIKKIFIDGAYRWDASKANLLNYGKALIPIIDAIERQGFRAEIWYCASSKGANNDKMIHYNFVRMKAPDEFLNREKLMFICGHMSMFRRFGFAIRELNADRDIGFMVAFEVPNGMGRSYNVDRGSLKTYNEAFPDDTFDIVFNLGHASSILNTNDVVNRNREQLKEQGVEI